MNAVNIFNGDQTSKAPFNKVYPIVLSKKQFDKKPSAFKQLHDELDTAETSYISLVELLEAVTKGQTFKNGIHAKPSDQYHDYKLSHEEESFLQDKQQELSSTEYFKAVRLMKQQKIKNELKDADLKDAPQFIETDLAILDVDDVLGKVNPIEVMKSTGAIALYYTFSHEAISPINTKMFRYRLLFDLSDTVQGKEALEAVQQEIKDSILSKYPHLHQQTFKNRSHGIDNITKMFFGSNRDYEINESFKTYDVTGVINRFNKERDFTKLVNKIERLGTAKTSTTDSEIIDMAHFLGDLNDELSYEEWIALSIGLWNTAQVEKIDDKVILEALQILDGNRQSNKDYMTLKQPLNSSQSQSSIGTMIKLATDRGYKRKYGQQPSEEAQQAPQIATRTHKIAKYIDKADMYKLLENDDERILVKSATNTGKTRASIEASKEYLKQHQQAFIYIALPTRALSQQVVEDFNLNKAVMGNLNVQKSVNQAIYNNSRLLVGTYDKTAIVCSLLSSYNVIVIADEVHKEVSDYNYRYKAIQSLFNLDVTKFIGLTGTPSEIDLNNYESLEVFKLDKEKVLADQLQFVNYSNANSYEKITAELIELEVKQNNNKVLAFINNKKLISKIARALRQQGLTVATITADNRKSKTYRNILEKQKFDDDTDIVLTTIVLADGININNSKDYVCMIAPSHYKNANFFNIDLIKQASNRFRKQYSKIIIPFYINSKLKLTDGTKEPLDRMSDRLYNLEHQYNYLLEKAEIMKAYIQTEFKNNIDDFTPSIAEKLAGLFRPKEADHFNFKQAYQNKQLAQRNLEHDADMQQELEQLEAKLWEIDKRAIRQQASEDKETYYSLFPHAFQKAIKQALNVLEVKEVQADDYLLEMNATDKMAQVIDDINQLEIQTEQEKRENVKQILHELIYAKIQSKYYEAGRINESLDEWKLLKKKMNTAHYKALTKLVSFMNYDEVIKELEYISKNAQMYELVNSFQAIKEVKHYRVTAAETVTEKIFNNIESNIIGGSYNSKKMLNEHLDVLAKDFKIKGRYTIAKRQQLFKQVFNKYLVTASSRSTTLKGKRIRKTTYKVISFEDVADKRSISVEEVKALYEKYNYTA